jgi:hypothetical protein
MEREVARRVSGTVGALATAPFAIRTPAPTPSLIPHVCVSGVTRLSPHPHSVWAVCAPLISGISLQPCGFGRFRGGTWSTVTVGRHGLLAARLHSSPSRSQSLSLSRGVVVELCEGSP